MLSHELKSLLAPFQNVVSRTSLLPLYKAIELAPDHVMACSFFGALDVVSAIGIDKPVYVDLAQLLAVVQSLPNKQEVKLSSNNGVLSWACGHASGRLACIALDAMPVLQSLPGTPTQATKELSTALELGSLSCDDNALGSVGMNGVVLDNTQNFVVASTDNDTLSAYTTNFHLDGLPFTMTLPAPGVRLLAAVIALGNGVINADDKTIEFASDTIYCAIRQVPPIKAGVIDIMAKYQTAHSAAKIPKDRVAAFVRRVAALTNNHREAKVQVSASDGRITLEFQEDMAASNEYFLADELPGFPAMAPVNLPAANLAKALAHIDEIVLDYLDRGVIMLRGGNFTYLISGSVSSS